MASSWDSEGIQRGARPFAWRGISWPGHQTEGKVCKTKKVLKYILIQNACDILFSWLSLLLGHGWFFLRSLCRGGSLDLDQDFFTNPQSTATLMLWQQNEHEGIDLMGTQSPILIVSTSDPLRHRWLRKRKRSILSDFSVLVWKVRSIVNAMALACPEWMVPGSLHAAEGNRHGLNWSR